ncbi:hypothetical protein J2X73_002754 [Novosphingobium sp. 1748]|uniref:hypothetical protein n=1 Tax=Novosphingobium sp. 1748 TaxID=2817760 RepID=UPI002855AC44|nr:hypothetical protein [Novosphingobium sp. 1748]MDR6708375.1 hypothetical protein [Novosphingobium sp. 1748]
MNRLDRQRQAAILHDLVEASSMRAIERKHQVSLNTVLKLLQDAGDMAIAYFKGLKDLECRYIQADEFHTFVGHRRKKREWSVPGEAWSGAGEIWVYLAIDADTKMVLDFLPGTHEVYDATKFMKSVASKLKRSVHGAFQTRPLVVVDGLPGYKEATAVAFGTDADVVMYVKKKSDTDRNGRKLGRSRYAGADKIILSGSPNLNISHTAFIERANLNVRMDNKRFARKSNAFSKTTINCHRQLALWAMYYNFCRVHRTLRVTPAMEAGLADHVWEVDEIVSRMDQFVAERLRAMVANDDECDGFDASAPQAPTHWVYHSAIHKTAKIHHADCCHCRSGEKQKRVGQKGGNWSSYLSYADAETAAISFEPDRHTICNICLGSYRTANGYRGPRS